MPVCHARMCRTSTIGGEVTVLAYAGAPCTCVPDTERMDRRSGRWWAAWPRTFRVYARRVACAMSCCFARHPARSIRQTGRRLRIVTASRNHRCVRASTARFARHHRMVRAFLDAQRLRWMNNIGRRQSVVASTFIGYFEVDHGFRLTAPGDAGTSCAAGFSSSYSDVLGCHAKRRLFLFVPSLIVMPGEHGLIQNV